MVDSLLGVLSVPAASAAVAVEMLGATIQGVVGFGINLVAAPLLILVDPRFVPAPVLLAAIVSSALIGIRERGSVDRQSVAWAFTGDIPGTVLGVLVVVIVGNRYLRPIVGAIVLAGVVVIAIRPSMRRGRITLFGVGLVSGVMSTVAGLGGAPLGLACNDLPGRVLRPTLAFFGLAGAMLSAAALSTSGQISTASIELTVLLLPGVFGGVVLSWLMIPFTDRWRNMRVPVLVLATIGAFAVIAKSIG